MEKTGTKSRATGATAKKAAPAPRKSAATSTRTSKTTSRESEPMLEEFFVDMLKDIYWAEKHLMKALPKMKKAATTEELQGAFEEHLAQTEEHITRLEQAFQMLGKKAQAKKCEAMEGLTKEADSIIEETEKGSMTRDVALIVAAQKVEHYEIASYGSLVQIANTMDLTDIAAVLEQTLQEEKETDQTLTDIAVNNINWEAKNEDGDAEEEEEDDDEVEEDEDDEESK